MACDFHSGLIAFAGFTSVAYATLFFSYHPRLFLRVFVPRDELRRAGRVMLRDPRAPTALRIIAALQFAAAVVVGIVVACTKALSLAPRPAVFRQRVRFMGMPGRFVEKIVFG